MDSSKDTTRSRFYLADTHVPKGFHLPGITDDARHALAECLEDNHKNVQSPPTCGPVCFM